MKKNIYLVVALLTGMFYACDYNEHYFDDFEDKTKPENIASYEYTFQDADVSTIVTALRSNKTASDSALADAFNKAKVFSEGLPASKLIPYLLKTKYIAGDVGSQAKITYNYDEKRDSVVTSLSTKSHEMSAADYKLVWGDLYPMAFTPKKAPASNIPTILKERYKDAEKGDLKNVTYEYSTDEPVDATVVGKILAKEDFETLKAYDNVTIKGWQTQDLLGTFSWQGRSYNNNIFANASSYNSKGKNDIYMISPEYNLSAINNPHLSFDVNVRNFTENCLSILVSDNFDGTNINSAKWTDISKSFDVSLITDKDSPDYDKLRAAGMGSLSAFNGKKVHIAFRYQGDDTSTPKRTTTYQIDNVQVFEAIPGVKVEESSTVYAAYEFDGSVWKASTGKEILQPSDYTAMNVTYLTTDNATPYISTYLKAKYPYDQKGATRVVVYKTKDSNQADEYIFDGTSWTPNTFIVTKTDQFVFANVNGVKQWIFDPTITETMQKSDYQILVDYVKAHQAVDNAALWDTRGNAEYYYGFSAYYPNVSYRDKDRSLDPLYPVNGSDTDKEKFCNDRTLEGVKIFLTQKYPNATPLVSGVVQYAQITLKVYSSHVSTLTNEVWIYKMQCTGTKEWKFIQRESSDRSGYIETAE